MLDSVHLLKNVANVNNFDVVKELTIHQGTFPLTFSIQLWQNDLGIRYIPAAGATVQVEFLRIDTIEHCPANQDVDLAMSLSFAADDRSIWSVDLTEDEVNLITSGGFRVTVVEGANTKQIFMAMAITKQPNSQSC